MELRKKAEQDDSVNVGFKKYCEKLCYEMTLDRKEKETSRDCDDHELDEDQDYFEDEDPDLA